MELHRWGDSVESRERERETAESARTQFRHYLDRLCEALADTVTLLVDCSSRRTRRFSTSRQLSHPPFLPDRHFCPHS